jgi:hypothetical protein
MTRAAILDAAVASVFTDPNVGKAYRRYGLTPAIAALIRARFRVLVLSRPVIHGSIASGA